MLDLPNWFWNAFAITVFVVINIILWFYFRRCKARGAKPKPAFEGMKKYEKHILRCTDCFYTIMILLVTFSYGKLIYSDYLVSLSEENTLTKGILIKNSFGFSFLMLWFYSIVVILMASWLSPFHKNITLKKRVILLLMSCVPMILGILAWGAFKETFGNTFESEHSYLLILLYGLLPTFFNWPAIFLGKPFFEFFSKQLRKIPLPWFRIPGKEENSSESSPEGTKGC